MEAYGASLSDVMSMTLKQIIMLSHASHITQKVMDNKLAANKKNEKRKKSREEANQAVFRGKKLDDLNSEEWEAYYGGGFG